MKRKAAGCCLVVMMIFLFTGCGNQMPDLDPQQAQMVGDFAAGLLMKYDAKYRSRLVELPKEQVPSPDSAEESTPPPEEPSSEEQQGGMPPVDDTPVMEPAGADASVSNQVSPEVCLGLPEGVVLAYQGEQIVNSYPDSDSYGVSAAPGKQLLVLSFLLENSTREEKTVDMLTTSPMFTITVNGNLTSKAMLTLLPDELSTYIGVIPGNISVSVVLIAEIDSAAVSEINSIALDIKSDSQTATIQLK